MLVKLEVREGGGEVSPVELVYRAGHGRGEERYGVVSLSVIQIAARDSADSESN